MKRKIEFTVTICLGGGDGGDVCVDVEVTNKEYKLLKECCKEGEDIDSFEGLEDLYKRIVAEASGESEFCEPDDYDDIDYDDAYYMVQMPDEIYDSIEDEE